MPGRRDEESLSRVWEVIPGIGYVPPDEEAYLRELFELGWVDNALSKSERDAAREAFYDAYGIDKANFPWDEWRRAMGYE